MKPLKLIVNGHEQDLKTITEEVSPMLELKKSIVITGTTRGDSKPQVLELETDSLLELVFDDETRWMCPADSLEDIYPGSLAINRDGEAYVELPSELDNPDLSRGFLGKIVLKVVNLFGKKAVSLGMEAIAKDLEEKQMGKLKGLVKINASFELEKFSGVNTANPILLFLHGTNSSAIGSFAELKGSELWDYMLRTYGNNILALQHETLTKSPLENAVDLVKQLPPNAVLDVVSHSRGGLIGEILCRFSGGSGKEIGFSDEEKEVLQGRKDVAHIETLQKLYPDKKFTVKKFIRVACPSSGTTILSKRLDYFFNISLNLLSTIPVFTANPVYAAMKNLLIAIVDQKNKPDVLPGLEAMKPDSPFITVLNNQSTPIAVTTTVIAISGNCKMKVNLKALVVIASKLFFFEDNDLVVNTKSMYNGTKRRDKLQFFFDEGADVDHFQYFKNKKTNSAILIALRSFAGPIDGFTENFRGTLGVAERNAILKLDGGEYSTEKPTGKKPIVVLLPGIMGTALGNSHGLIWINYLKFLTGGLSHLGLDEKDRIKDPQAIVKTSYKALGEALTGEYDVVAFGFDWRLSLETSAEKFNALIIELMTLNQPIKIVGHSMGGVLVRDFMVFHPATWKKLNALKDFRLLFLGSPLGGSFRINNVLFGEDDIINKLSKIDIVHTKKKLIKMFATFPGLLCLLPFNTDEQNDFAKESLWKTMRTAFGVDDWDLPSDTDLKNFGSYRDKIINATTIDYSNAVYIAGQYKETPSGYRIDETIRGKELVFLSTPEGDQSVTWESGIPKKMIEDRHVYYANCSHGALSNTASIFNAIKEILRKGETNLITKNRPTIRGGVKEFKRIVTSDFDFSPEGLENTILGLEVEDKVISNELPLKVTVSHGDLKFASYPVLAGHFKNDGILYAESRIDGLLGGILMQLHKLALYPGETGTHEIQLTYSDGFPGAIIVGLDQPDNLTAFELTKTVEQGIIKYLIKVNGREANNSFMFLKEPLGISSLIIACGYGGLSVENSVAAILQGITNANAKVKILYSEKGKLIEHVEFVELYEDKALNAYVNLRQLGKESGGTLNINLELKNIKKLSGAQRQMYTGQDNQWWNRITITQQLDTNGGICGMNFSISTGAAKEDLRTVFTGSGVVEQLIEGISTDNDWTEERARAIFELLVPNDFKSRLKRHGNIVWVLDDYTAGFPWELLQDKSKGAKPICINAGMIRQLKTANSNADIETVATNNALVIGDPNLNGFFSQLPGARREGEMVARLLEDNGYVTKPLIGDLDINIVSALMSYDYKIVHLAAHGVFNPDQPRKSGVVIGKESYLSTAVIKQISGTQQLVFVNCCYLGKSSGADETFYQSRYKLAANIGTQFINNGVKAVIVAGWAVDDTAALAFAKRFYDCMFQGKTFGEAVRMAREDIYNSFGKKNTWGAYQCYGDPFYKLDGDKWDDKHTNYVISEQVVIDLSNLLNSVKSGEDNDRAAEKLEEIIRKIFESGIEKTAEIIELEALIYKELNDYQKAIERFKDLTVLEDASYSFIAAEQYCSIRIKRLVDKIENGETSPASEEEFDEAILDLDALIRLNPSIERYAVRGSAYKRKIYFYKNKTKVLELIKESLKDYELAYAKSKEKSAYSFINLVILHNILVLAGNEHWSSQTPVKKGTHAIELSVKEINQKLDAFENENLNMGLSTDYWENIIIPNIQLCRLLMKTTAPDRKKKITWNEVWSAYNNVWKMTGSKEQKKVEVQQLKFIVYAVTILVNEQSVPEDLKALLQRFKEETGTPEA